MPLPAPEPGLVICYEFLWSHEFSAGYSEGEKKRPCIITLISKPSPFRSLVTVVPITHSRPTHPEYGIGVPDKVKAHLGLDGKQQWVILDELNRFEWPGTDIYSVPGGRYDQFEYGFVPPIFHSTIAAAIVRLNL